MRVAFQAPVWPAKIGHNGIATYVDTMAEALSKQGVGVDIFAYNLEANPNKKNLVSSRLIDFSVKNHKDKIFRKLFPQSYSKSKFLESTVKYIKLAGCKVFEMEEARGDSFFLKSEKSIKMVLRLHGPWFLNGSVLGLPMDDNFRLRVKNELRAIRAAEYITAPSVDVIRRVEEFYEIELSHAVCIPNPVKVRANLHWKRDDVLERSILFVGRFDKHKGGDIILLAFKALVDQFPDLKLIFVGPDRGVFVNDELYDFEKYVDIFLGKHLRNNIDYRGALSPSEIEKLRLQCSLVVAPSRYDNFPYTVLESMALGCPVVASNAGGASEMIEDGINGFLFQSGSTDSLVSVINNILNGRHCLVSISNAAISKVASSYSPEIIVENMLDFYKKI